MRDAGPVIVITIALLLVGGIVFYIQRGSIGQVVGAVLGPAPRTYPVETPVEEAKGEEKPKPSPAAKGAKARSQASIDVAPDSRTPGVQQIVVDVPERQAVPFPTATELSPGTDRAAMVDQFGSATVRTITLEDGGVVELHVYLQKNPRLATYARVRNGKVVSASTTTY